MAERDVRRDPDEPSLELPSLGFGRSRRRRRDAASAEARARPATRPEPAPPPPPDPQAATATTIPAATCETVGETDGEPVPRRAPRPPRLGAVPASLVTGLVVGLVTVGLVWASLRLCELMRGTSTCGDPGFLLLVAVLVVAGLVGGLLLRVLGVPEGGSISFLGLGLVAVILMLLLGDHLFAWWMVLAVPAVGMASYVLAQRLTTAAVEPTGPDEHR